VAFPSHHLAFCHCATSLGLMICIQQLSSTWCYFWEEAQHWMTLRSLSCASQYLVSKYLMLCVWRWLCGIALSWRWPRKRAALCTWPNGEHELTPRIHTRSKQEWKALLIIYASLSFSAPDKPWQGLCFGGYCTSWVIKVHRQPGRCVILGSPLPGGSCGLSRSCHFLL